MRPPPYPGVIDVICSRWELAPFTSVHDPLAVKRAVEWGGMWATDPVAVPRTWFAELANVIVKENV